MATHALWCTAHLSANCCNVILECYHKVLEGGHIYTVLKKSSAWVAAVSRPARCRSRSFHVRLGAMVLFNQVSHRCLPVNSRGSR